jgi:Photosynthesis system II assembly factor YCF48/Putative zinc-finger
MTELPKIVAQRLQRPASATPHPDPNLLAAFVESSLLDRERTQVLEHLSQCADCREIVSLSVPEQAEVGARAVGAHTPWLSWPVLRWGALAACFVVVGAAVSLRYRSHPVSLSSEKVQHAELPIAGEAKVAQQPPLPSEIAANKKESQPALLRRDAGAATMARLKPDSRVAELRAQTAAQESAGSLSKMAAVPAPAKAENAELDAAAETATGLPSNNMAEVVPGKAKDAEAVQADNAPSASGGVAPKQKASVALFAAKALPAPSPKLVPRWTLSSDGTLQRSLDSGRTWETIPLNSQAAFRALAANGLDIWVGGSSGTLYHSTDAGQHWTQVQPVADGEPLTADIIGVEFTDPLHGTVTTSSKETWITADAGQNWRKK